jgi:DnaJ-like protein/uncharacterized protein DUF4388/tetratricopeptide repeat protein
VSDDPTKPPRPAGPGGPPKLDRVPSGYRPARVRPPPAAEAAKAPRPAAAPAAAYGLSAREVGADAAFAAGIPLEGTLASDSTLRLFYLAAATQAQGRLTLELPAATFALAFRKGTVEHASSSSADDDLGRFLVRKGALTPEGLLRAEAARAPAGADLASALIAARLVNPADVAGYLQEHRGALVSRALAGEEGSWRWEPAATPPPSSFPLGNPLAMLCGAVRALELGAVERRLGDRESRAASRVGGRVRLEELRLTPQEARAAGLFDGRSPAEIAAAQPADAPVVLRLALLLGETELLAFGEERKAAPKPAASAPPPAAAARPPAPVASPPPAPLAPPATPPAPKATPAAAGAAEKPAPTVVAPSAAKPPPPRPAPSTPPRPALTPWPATTPAPRPAPKPPVAVDAAHLHALLEKLAGADHFEALGVKRDAPAAQVKIAYFQLAKVYHPDAIPPSAPADVRKIAADVFGRVSEAWGVLGDETQRAQYLQELQTGSAASVDVMNILHAENVFQAGTLLVKARKYDEAIAKFEEATKLNPDEAEFAMWKAWCEYLLGDDRKRQLGASAAAIEAGLKKNPRCAQGHLFLGQMAKLGGDVGSAEKHFRRGLAVAPEHAELQRELKYLRK